MIALVDTYIDDSVPCFSIPEEIIPPRVNKYVFKVNSSLDVTESQINDIASILGSGIKVDDGKYTPLQMKKLTVLLGSISGFVASSVLYTEAIFPFVGVVGMIASLIIGIKNFAYHHSFYDLDNAKERQALFKAMRTWDFKKIIDHFTADQVIRYDLFRDKLSAFNKEENLKIYANINNVYSEKAILDKTQKELLDKVSKAYDAGEKAVSSYYPARLIYVNGVLTTIHDSQYYKMLDLWYTWERKEKANIAEGYGVVMNRLNASYTKCFETAKTEQIQN